jgi:hypothetical protein
MKYPKITVQERKLGRYTERKDCRPPQGLAWPDGRVDIDPRQGARAWLNTLIHELLHQILPEADENQVFRCANILSKHLWEQGFRKTKKCKDGSWECLLK